MVRDSACRLQTFPMVSKLIYIYIALVSWPLCLESQEKLLELGVRWLSANTCMSKGHSTFQFLSNPSGVIILNALAIRLIARDIFVVYRILILGNFILNNYNLEPFVKVWLLEGWLLARLR